MPGKRDKDRQVWSEGESDVAVEDEQKLSRPRRYKVLLLNDDYTTMEFVVQILTGVFHHTEEQAIEIMLHVHHNGVGLAGVYSLEVAETKVNKVTQMARENEFPLHCDMEPE